MASCYCSRERDLQVMVSLKYSLQSSIINEWYKEWPLFIIVLYLCFLMDFYHFHPIGRAMQEGNKV